MMHYVSCRAASSPPPPRVFQLTLRNLYIPDELEKAHSSSFCLCSVSYDGHSHPHER